MNPIECRALQSMLTGCLVGAGLWREEAATCQVCPPAWLDYPCPSTFAHIVLAVPPLACWLLPQHMLSFHPALCLPVLSWLPTCAHLLLHLPARPASVHKELSYHHPHPNIAHVCLQISEEGSKICDFTPARCHGPGPPTEAPAVLPRYRTRGSAP
jgi:hypothetical protein